jgi:hypothetical protein
VALSVLSLTAVGFAASGSDRVAGKEGATGRSPPRVERTVEVYASVIRQLVTKDHGYGGADPGFGVVYVIDGIVEGAQNPGRPVGEPKPEKPFGHRAKKGLRKALADLPPIKFVDDVNSVLPGEPPSFSRYCSTRPASCRVINNGVLVTLGPIGGDRARVEVGNNLWINLLAGRWGTYVLERRGGSWEVTGTTGPEVIS